MGIFSWFRTTKKLTPSVQPLVLTPPWRRETLDAIYCSEECFNNAGQGMLASQGKTKPCCFCQTSVRYGDRGVVYMPFLTEPNLVCPNCHSKAQGWNARQRECSFCGKPYAAPEVAVPPKPTAAPEVAAPPRPPASSCANCSVELAGWHYDFESITMDTRIGSQCPGCGKYLCKPHSEDTCSNCAADTLMLLQGPAQSSMVADANRRGKYNKHIVPPIRSGRAQV